MGIIDQSDPLWGGTNPQSTAIDLTNHPIIMAAIEASYRQEDQIAAAKVVVGIVSRALQMVPIWGPALANVVTGAVDQGALVAQIQQAQAASTVTGSTAVASSGCPLSSFLQSSQVQGLVGSLTQNPQVLSVMKGLFGVK